MEAGEGWLLSETPFPGELWSLLSPLLLQVWSGMLASSLNSCPDIIRSISSSDIWWADARSSDRKGNINRNICKQIQTQLHTLLRLRIIVTLCIVTVSVKEMHIDADPYPLLLKALSSSDLV